MKATILTIGTEILFGSIVNTNAAFLSQQLNFLGVDVLRHITVGDNEGRLLRALEEAFEDCDAVFTTGGLGPTEDDMTKETIAKFFGVKLKENEAELKKLKGWFEKNNRVMAPNNIKMTWLPEGSTVLNNAHGTAPGFEYTDGKRTIFVMPGPPREMKPMFLTEIAPKLSAGRDGYLHYKMVRTIGIGESDLEMALIDLIDGQTDPTIATYAKDFSCSFRVASKRKTFEESSAAVEDMLSKIRPIVGQYIYSEDDEELSEVVFKMLKERNLKISSAESITGGQFAKEFTDIPGASGVFERGFVTYSNKAKSEDLGVDPAVIEKYGAVSKETAAAMAEGLKKRTGSDVCISVTGHAGPDTGDELPVGLFYIGLCCNGKTLVKEFQSRRKVRSDIRNYAVLQMFKTVYEAVK